MSLEPVKTLAEAEHFLFEALPKSPKTLFKHGKGIQRSKIFFELIGNPQNNLNTIHIAATSGKGSTSHILDELLRAHGKTVGLHVSPHVYDYRERMIINGELVNEQVLVDALNSLLTAIDQMRDSDAGRPTYFEVSNALAFSIFDKHNLDYTILETGLGGLNDSTNTISRADKLAVIGQIGIDHVKPLGEADELVEAANNDLIPQSFTKIDEIIERIAVQKAGIMPFNGNALALKQKPEINAIFEQLAAFRHTRLQWVTRKDIRTPLNLPGDFQRDNASLALDTLEYLANRDGWTISPKKVEQALASVRLPGRFEIREIKNKTVILDGSHNPQKMKALVEAFKERYPGRKAVAVTAMAKTKDTDGTLVELSLIADKIICTDFFTNKQDFKSASLKPDELAEVAATSAQTNISVATSHQNAIDQAFATDADIILVTGSFYFLGEINTLLT